MVYFAACVYEGGSFTPPNRDLKKMYVANFSFVKLRDDRETSIFGNTRHVSMQYKGKSFTVEGFKASKYTLFSLKKKSSLFICCHQSPWLCFLFQENRLSPVTAFWMFHQGGDKPLCCLLRRGPWYLNHMSALGAHMSCRTSSLC